MYSEAQTHTLEQKRRQVRSATRIGLCMSNSSNHLQQLSEREFMRLFLKHEPALRAFARSLLPDWDSVDNAIQEASVTMWEKLSQLRDEDGFLPWAKVILRFKCLSTIARLRRDRHLLSDSVLQRLAQEAEAIEAEEHAAARRALQTCLGKFSEPHRELLLAPYAGDGRIVRLAATRGKTANALYKLLGRLRAKLADCVRRQLSVEAS